jgi:hypothetical protein
MMPKDLKDLLCAFNDHNVRYLVVGGMRSAFTQNREPPKTWIFSSAQTKRTALPYFARSLNTALL